MNFKGSHHLCIPRKAWETIIERVNVTTATLAVNSGTHVSAAAAAKSLQSCPTLCNPIDGSPPGSSIPGILQARILEWVTISFSILLDSDCLYGGDQDGCIHAWAKWLQTVEWWSWWASSQKVGSKCRLWENYELLCVKHIQGLIVSTKSKILNRCRHKPNAM